MTKASDADDLPTQRIENRDSSAVMDASLSQQVRSLQAALELERRLRRQEKKAFEAQTTKSTTRSFSTQAGGSDRTMPLAQVNEIERTQGDALDLPPRPLNKNSQLVLPAGYNLQEYRIEAVLGQGGFGITYLATDVHLSLAVAIKEYLPSDFADRFSDFSVHPNDPSYDAFYQNWLDSFLVEARTLATFRHPHIVRVARFFEANNTAYMVLDYERGNSLKEWWRTHKDMPEVELAALLQPLLDGLAVVHQHGYLHRDIKPDNIYVRRKDGSLVLLDFGSASLVASNRQNEDGVVTPGYAPIEQYTGGQQGPWTDIYAFGATLYWMVCGIKPHPAPDRQMENEPMPSAETLGAGRFSVEFLQAIDWALDTDPTQRPQTVAAFSQALFANHAGSLGLQEALSKDEQTPAAVGWQALRRSPKLLLQRARDVFKGLTRPASWPMTVKMTFALVLAALLPMLITAYYNLNAGVENVTRTELRNLERFAESTSGRVAQLVTDTTHLATFLGTDEDFIEYLRKPDDAQTIAITRKLMSLEKANPDIDLLMVMNQQGVTLASNDPTVTGKSFAFRQYFKSAMAGRSYMTGIIVGARAGLPGIYYSQPVFNEKRQVEGVVVLRIRGAAISKIVYNNEENSDRAPFMVDGDGVVIQHQDPKKLYHSLVPLNKVTLNEVIADQRFRRDRIDSLNLPELASVMVGAKKSGNATYSSNLTGSEIAGFAPVPGTNWVVGVSESRKDFEAPLNRMFVNVLYSVAVVGLIFVLIAILFSRSFVRPILRLTKAAEALKAGDYDKAHVVVTAHDEVGRLARTFNVMIDILRQRERERRSQLADADPTRIQTRRVTSVNENPK